MRIRLPFAGVFFVLLLVAGYAGLTSLQVGGTVNDKVLHFVTFFLLTVVFYWIVDTSRRRTLNMALAVCTFGLGVGSEVLQAAIPDNGREFDLMDIVANILGSLAALGLCSWYHKRMLERKRRSKYSSVPGEEGAGGDDDEDLELGERVTLHDNDDTPTSPSAAADTPASTATSGTTGSAAGGDATGTKTVSLEAEVDNWDENAEDPWEEDDDGDIGAGPSGSSKKGKAAVVTATMSDEVSLEPKKKHAD